ncbi:hypothetical protein [Rheinheimera metallidurans]|uniref:hypothetical protein n=1 Tax=Rheinheimera metallidurans TaxID=2925781 RepID=UPI00300342B9
MKLKLLSIAALILISAPISAATFITENNSNLDSKCFEHCIETSRIGASVSILWKGANGVPIKVITADVPKDAVLVAESVSQPTTFPTTNNNASQSGGGYSTVATNTYVTTTEIITVITTLTFDNQGNLLSVNVHTVSVKLPAGNMEQ